MFFGGFGEMFPYTNFHNLNLDWIIRTIIAIDQKFDKAISSKITIADPIEWNITKQYESLMVVVTEERAYLSIQAVPSGVSITNTDYWQPIFDMSTLYDMINDWGEALQRDIEYLEETTEKNNADRHILYIGDSYSTLYTRKMVTLVQTKIGIPASRFHDISSAGSGFTIAGNSFLSLAQGYTGDKTEITDILIVGGINDALLSFNNYTTSYPNVSVLTDAISAFKTYCNSNYPNARVNLAYVGGCLADSGYYETLHPAKSQEWALWAYTTYAGGLGYRILKTANAIHTARNNYAGDGLHPSEDYGVVAIAESVANAFNNNPIINNRPSIQSVIHASNDAEAHDIPTFVRIDNDQVIFTIPDFYVQITSGKTVGVSDFTPIINLYQANNNPTIRNPYTMNTVALFHGFTDVDPVFLPVAVLIENGIISIKVYKIHDSHSYDTLTAGGFATITFPSLNTITLPLWSIN